MPRVLMNSGLFVDREGERMQVLADHVYHVLVIAFVAGYRRKRGALDGVSWV